MTSVGWSGHCYTCKEPMSLCAETYGALERSGNRFMCPWGHPNMFGRGKTGEQKLQEQWDAERRSRQRAEQRVAEYQDEAKHERHRANAYKGHATRITRRAKAGVCPCCNRHFAALERHMTTKHPDFTPLKDDAT